MRYFIPLAAVALGVLACSGNDGPSGNNPPDGDIIVGNNFFDPETFTATAGTPVVWAWAGGVTHNVTFDDDAPGSGNKDSGTFQRTFSAAGAYTFLCTIHGRDAMGGVVNVSAAGGSGGGGGSGGTPSPY